MGTKQELPDSGERMKPEVRDAQIITEHLHRYLLATQFCEGKSVLDIASGEGYGTNILSGYAKNVIGIDIDESAIQFATRKYSGANISFKTGSATTIPMDDKTMDVVVSFETLEHLDKQDEMLKEIKRVLKNDGIMVMSTPDKKYYSDIPGYKNPYHVKELYSHEFRELISRHFEHVQLLAQYADTISVIYPFEDQGINSYWSAKGDIANYSIDPSISSRYLIAIAGQSRIDYKPLSIFDGKEIEKRLRSDELESVLKSKTYKLGNFFAAPFRWVKSMFK